MKNKVLIIYFFFITFISCGIARDQPMQTSQALTELHDIWVVVMDSTNPEALKHHISIEFNTQTFKIYGSDNYCNFSGDFILYKNEIKLLNFVFNQSCEAGLHENIINQFKDVLFYKREGLYLYLMNQDKKVLLTLKKVD